MFGNFFDISLTSLNLASFMGGMTFAFFNQGLFGKRIGKYIVIYLVGLAGFYGFSYYVEKEVNKQTMIVEEVNSNGIQSLSIPIPR